MAKKQDETVKKTTTKVRIEFLNEKATIYREGLPFISDKIEKSVKWLNENGYKSEEIEVVGNKPECWNTIFPPSSSELNV